MKTSGKVTVPFFISHQGCPHQCVFCDQCIISSSSGQLPDSKSILSKIAQWQCYANGRPLEVAFFGGTFTALPETTQQMLLEPLQPLIRSGEVESIRVSTRPDCISDRIMEWLTGMGVGTVELGVQSMDDTVLAMTGRGYTAAVAAAAIGCAKRHGVTVVAQLMPGLPCDTVNRSLDSLRAVIRSGADQIRIYPTVVLKGTKLADMYTTGAYCPLSLQAGVDVSKRLLLYAIKAGVDVIRIGLQADDGLNADNVLAGCWHPALGQLVQSELYFDLLRTLQPRLLDCGTLQIACHPSRVSDVVGHGRYNLERLRQSGIEIGSVVGNKILMEHEVMVSHIKQQVKLNLLTDLDYA